jgi:hypothetical protein
VTALVAERLEALVIARLETMGKKPLGPATLVKSMRRFAPREQTDAQWRETILGIVDGLRGREIADAKWRIQAGELMRRIGHTARTWRQLVERVLPGLALGIDPNDKVARARLGKSNGWASAIVARALGVWRAGPPPTLNTLGDLVVWQTLALPGKPKMCPPEVRAHFLSRHLAGEPGQPERHVRVLAARAVDAPRAELNALLDGLVRLWLAGQMVGEPVGVPSPTEPPPPAAAAPRSLIDDVRAVTAAAREGVFGERKVFISAIWTALRAMPAWASLELDDLKAQLVDAHRRRELVLARADLVAAMDPDLVAASETRTDGATFHFVVREPTT